MVAPVTAASIIYSKRLQAVGIHRLGVTLEHQPGPATGEHDPAIFRKFGTDVACQQAVVATGQRCPANRYSQHCAASVGVQKNKIFAQQFGPLINPFYTDIFWFRQHQKGGFSMLNPIR